MARVILGNGIASLRGSIGGTVYSGGNSGTVAKNRPSITRKTSTQAATARYLLGAINQAWSTMQLANKVQWDNFSVFKPTAQKNNPSRFLNGHQIFLYYNYAKFFHLGTYDIAPVYDTTAPVLTGLTLANVAGALILTSATAIDEADDFVIFKISGRVKQGRRSAPGGVKYISTFFNNTTTCDITTAYVAYYGVVPGAGSYVEISYQLFRTSNTNWSNKVQGILQIS